MIVYDLICSMDHRFEGWFSNRQDFIHQRDSGTLACPVCGVQRVERLPSASRLNLKHPRHNAELPQERVDPARAPAKPEDADLVGQLKDYIQKHYEDVGSSFAEEAKKIHYGETERRNIRGQATADEVGSLLEEGIDAVPLPPGLSADKDKLN